jgi:hypothetical protein
MKTIIYIVSTMLCLIAIPLQAQSDDRRENLEFGVKAGLNLSNIWDDASSDFQYDSKVGGVFGAYVGIPLGSVLGIQPEVLISQKGFQGSGTLLNTPYSFSRTTTFVDVPLQLQIKPTEFFTLLVGPQYSYLIKQKDNYTFGTNSNDQEQEFKNENIRKNILGAVLGADFIFQNFVISARVSWDLQTNKGDGTSSTPRYKNQLAQLTIGLKI